MGEWVDTGAKNIAEIYFSNQPQNSTLYMGLFTTDLVEATFETIDFTTIVEPVASTYARLPLAPANWIVAGGQASYPEVAFDVTLESFGVIYGCFIATSLDNSGVVLAMHKFPASALLQYYGDRLGITPRITIT